MPNMYKLAIQNYSYIALYEKLHTFNMSKTDFAIVSSSLSLMLSYPFEVGNTKMCGDMTRWEHKRLYSNSLEIFTKSFEERSIYNQNIKEL